MRVPAARRAIAASVLVLAAACGGPAVSPSTPPAAPIVLRYVALGDSYTIGTSVGTDERWPVQLVARLAADPPPRTLQLAANLGVNGYTAGAVLRDALPLVESGPPPGFMSLLVGVNDVVQGVPEATYRTRVEEILGRLLALLPANRIVCVETPDYTVTPSGADYGDPATQRAAIVRVNAVLADACASRGVRFVDGILAISRDAAADASLVAADGLHPSGAQYRRWVEERIEPAVRELLAQP